MMARQTKRACCRVVVLHKCAPPARVCSCQNRPVVEQQRVSGDLHSDCPQYGKIGALQDTRAFGRDRAPHHTNQRVYRNVVYTHAPATLFDLKRSYKRRLAAGVGTVPRSRVPHHPRFALRRKTHDENTTCGQHPNASLRRTKQAWRTTRARAPPGFVSM